MKGINRESAIMVQQPVKRNKTAKHFANAVAVGTGLGCVGCLYLGAKYTWHKATTSKLVSGKNLLTPQLKVAKKVVNLFENLGEKIFKNRKLSHLFEQYSKGRCFPHDPEFYTKSVKSCKGIAALILTLGLSALSVIGAGLYRAGKINGEG